MAVYRGQATAPAFTVYEHEPAENEAAPVPAETSEFR
jgi:hypothetical protein